MLPDACFVPKADICTATKNVLFDHLVGAAKKRERNCEAQCFGSLLVDHKLKFCRLLDRQIGWFFALENSPDVCAR